MKDFWQKLWIKIGRMGRTQFFFIHLCMILGIIASPFLCGCAIFLICGDGNGSFGCKTIEGLVERLLDGDGLGFITLSLYLLSNFFLAKRFQDCGICGQRAFIIGLISPIILSIIGAIISYLLPLHKQIDLLILFGSIPRFTYLIVLIIMCFEKGDVGPNKYGNPV